MTEAAAQALQGLRVLVVEDTLLLADCLVEALDEAGCEVVGPAPRLQQALDLAGRESLHAALLDVNLAGEFCFPVAELLERKGVPFVFLTGYSDNGAVPQHFRDRPRLSKPTDAAAVRQAIAAVVGAPAAGRKPSQPNPVP
ncbi:MAG TPA: response regulator [Acetobacteraceae bacterium]|nr:response regulator [Acetobacteraceae bacterium]